MVLLTLKRGEPWDVMAQSHGMTPPVFEKLIVGFVEVIGEYLYDLYVDSVPAEWPMERLLAERKQFEFHPTSYYAVDVRFQPTNRPSGNHLESKPFFSGKHNLYGVKTEVSVTPVGLAVNLSRAAKGSVSDKTMMVDNLATHRRL